MQNKENQETLTVAISSRALFDFEEENTLFEKGDTKQYMKMQLEKINIPAKAGIAFSLIKKLLTFNENLKENQKPLVQVVALSRNDPVSGMRVFNSAAAHQIPLERGVFTQGADPFKYLRPLKAHLFLSANQNDVRQALELGYPAAHVAINSAKAQQNNPREVRIAFDGDAVLFADQAEQIFQKQGLPAFVEHEKKNAKSPLPDGPFKPLLKALHNLQKLEQKQSPMKLRTVLVTARSAPAHERAIRTLMHWGIEIDEAMFLGGLPKGEFLKEFEPDFFFDDQSRHIEQASKHVPAGHVISGISNL